MGAFSKLQAFKFAALLAKPFNKWDAFEDGIIDDKGSILIKKPKMDTFSNLVRKIKKLMIKYIPDNNLFQFLVAAYLLKSESTQNENYLNLIEHLDDNEINLLYNILDAGKNLKI